MCEVLCQECEWPWISLTRLMPRESPEQTDEGSVLAWSMRARPPRGGPGQWEVGGGGLPGRSEFIQRILGAATGRIETGIGGTGEAEP